MSKRREEAARNERLAEEYLLSADGGQGPEPRPGFAEAAYHRIQARLEKQEKEGRREARMTLGTSHRARRAILIPVVALALMVFFTAGAFAFSLNASPDSSLYGTKLFFEGTRLTFTGSDEAKVDYEVELVNERLRELENMVARGMGRGGAHWETAYNNNVNRLYEEIMSMPEERQAELLEYAAGLLEQQAVALAALSAEAPQDLSPHIEGARNCGMGVTRGMRERCRQQGEETPGSANGGENCPGGGNGNDNNGMPGGGGSGMSGNGNGNGGMPGNGMGK
jgi:uncharacterized membrane protein YgcG